MAGGVLLGDVIGGEGINPNVVRIVLIVMALGLAGYIVGPPLYWHVAEALGDSSACPPCAACDCSAQPLLSLPEELINLSSTGHLKFLDRWRKWNKVYAHFDDFLKNVGVLPLAEKCSRLHGFDGAD